jgi:hypothetical protein
MNKLIKNPTKKQLLKVLPEVREISVGIAISEHTLNNITISKAQFKKLLEIASGDEVLSRASILFADNGTFIIL